jgi:hypothetical protein
VTLNDLVEHLDQLWMLLGQCRRASPDFVGEQ